MRATAGLGVIKFYVSFFLIKAKTWLHLLTHSDIIFRYSCLVFHFKQWLSVVALINLCDESVLPASVSDGLPFPEVVLGRGMSPSQSHYRHRAT